MKKWLFWFGVYFTLGAVKRWVFGWWIVAWWLGGIASLMFEWADRLVYVYLTRPHEQLSIQIRYVINQGRYGEAMQLLKQRKGEQARLSGKSFLFLLAWIPLAFFVVTSTTSWFGKGLVMGIGLKALYEMTQGYGLWQANRQLHSEEIKKFGYGFGGLFILISLFL
jgi:hypothetical protein